jgi:hypothetical protein
VCLSCDLFVLTKKQFNFLHACFRALKEKDMSEGLVGFISKVRLGVESFHREVHNDCGL